MPTKAAAQALSILRDPNQFQWYAIPLLLIAVYVYAGEIQGRRWSVVFGGLAFWGMDWFNEVWNGLVFHFTNYAPVWSAPGRTAFLILIGVNIEIVLTFAVLGVTFCKLLPADRRLKVMGVPNRWFLVCAMSAGCVVIEYFLNWANALIWESWWWNVRMPWLIFLIGYVPFFIAAFVVHDMKDTRRQAIATGVILGFDLACLVTFAGVLRWI